MIEKLNLKTLLLPLLTTLVAGSVFAQAVPQPRLDTTTLRAGMHLIQAELARTDQQQEIGLMMRAEMAAHEGMLFVFRDKAPRCFWMRNTLLPLTIAFIDDDGRIVNLADMKPRSEDSHCAAKPVRFALEMNQGWFAKRNIAAGYRLEGPPFSR
jgi:uncharacterized membrane protein (UPF0127 family)